MAPTVVPTLPFELIQAIVEDAWLGATNHDDRRELFRALSASHPFLDKILISTFGNYPTFHVNTRLDTGLNARLDSGAAPLEDIDLYRTAVERHVLAHQHPQGSTDILDTETPLCPPMHVRLDVTHFRAVVASQNKLWEDYINALKELPSVTSAHSLTITSTHITRLTRRPAHPGYAPGSLLLAANAFPSLTHLRLDCDWRSHGNGLSKPLSISLPTVRFLRIRAPQCHCVQHPRGAAASGPEFMREHCLLARLLAALPRLAHIHLDTPLLLEFLLPPRSVRTLTLEAAVVPRVGGEGEGKSRTLIGYKVAGAVRAGLLQGLAKGLGPGKIWVRSRAADTWGYEAALQACQAHGVQFEEDM